jgi:nucleoside phosphorylase/CheY-like chemotaxis protein
LIRALIVEDDPDKSKRIVETLADAGIASADIAVASTIQGAKTWLRSNACDVLVLDLNIPRRDGDTPTYQGGVELLDEISLRDRYSKPAHVIGLTQYEEVFRYSTPAFSEALIPLIMYGPDETWKRKLRNRIEYLISTKIATVSKEIYDFDIAVLTAMERPELEAVLKIPWNWSDWESKDDDTRYFQGTFNSGSRSIRILAAACPAVGMPSAACLATKIIGKFRPQYLIHCGIAAGIRGRVEIGDVLVADPSWDWGSGKFVTKDSKVVFYAAPYQFPLREEMRSKIRRLAADELELARLKLEWAGPKPPSSLKVVLGPVASGAAVLSDDRTADQIEDQHRKVIGIEMETYGIFAAAEFCARPRPLTLSLKSVSDFADPSKNDDFQAYASYTSARCFQVLAEKYFFPLSR